MSLTTAKLYYTHSTSTEAARSAFGCTLLKDGRSVIVAGGMAASAASVSEVNDVWKSADSGGGGRWTLVTTQASWQGTSLITYIVQCVFTW
jgi:hypothetical protein